MPDPVARPRLLLAAALLAFAATAAVAEEPIPIAQARALPLGTVVTVLGSVTVPSGAFSSSTFDQGFTLQDKTAGIYVSVAADLGLGIGRQVRVTGALADNGTGVLTIVPADLGDVVAGGLGRRVAPQKEATASIGEATEGLLVRVKGVISAPIVPDPPYGTIVELDDGSGPIRIFVCASTGIDLSGLAEGDAVSVVGMSYQFLDYEVDPRFQSDVRRRGD
jgi:hypothetical protein